MMFSYLSKKILFFLTELGNISMLFIHTVVALPKAKNVLRHTVDQMVVLGTQSIPITVLTAFFVGLAFTVQVLKEFMKFGAGEMIGGIVALATWRELAPLLTGVAFAGRVGAAISAEIGTMKVTEQIDALETLSQNPIHYLVVPRLLACTIMMPLLVGLADVVGFLSGFVIACGSGQINPYAYLDAAQTMLTVQDITGGLIKAFCFGILIAIISCHIGLQSKAGAKGVGQATTSAVVLSLISIFVLNYFLSVLLF